MTAYELDAIREVEEQVWADSPHLQRFQVRYFTSRSKGRGRQRKHWEEVTLIKDTWEPRQPRWYSETNFPYDEKATETFPQAPRDEAENRLIDLIERLK